VSVAIRDARPEDAEQIALLIEDLGHAMDSAAVAATISTLARHDCAQRVAVAGDRILGLCGLHVMTVVHRPLPVGRITILEVAEDCRGQGIGRLLVNDAEQRLRAHGCGLLEVTSNERLVKAHAFYRHLGFDQTSKRFAKPLA
jgi:GNAT superfamily N-acetyltransferase